MLLSKSNLHIKRNCSRSSFFMQRTLAVSFFQLAIVYGFTYNENNLLQLKGASTLDNHAAPKQRIAYLDLLRVLSAYLVVLYHTVQYIHLDEVAPATRFFCLTLQAFSKVAVPVFLMISGCVLLPKSDNIIRVISRTGRIAAALILFSLVHAVLNVYRGTVSSFRISSFLDSIYRNPIFDTYWYLYAYLGLLIMMPLLQKLAKVMTKTDFIYYFAISTLVYAIWPLVVEYTPVSEYYHLFSLPLMGTHLCYLFLGYALHRIPREKLCVPALVVIAAIATLGNALLMTTSFNAGSKTYLFTDNIAYLPVLLCSVCLFLLARCVVLSSKTSNILQALGKCTFGSYLITDLFLIVCIPFYYTMRDAVGQVPAFMVYHLIMFALAMTVTALLRRIPFVREIL